MHSLQNLVDQPDVVDLKDENELRQIDSMFGSKEESKEEVSMSS